jgi:hypothetical protein
MLNESQMDSSNNSDVAVPERRIAIYIDGATFHMGANLKRDKYLRDKLRNENQPWTVVELRVRDLNDVSALISTMGEAT